MVAVARVLAVLIVIGSVAGAVRGQEPQPLRFPGKVDPRVLADTRGGRAAHFIVAMRDQADVASLADSAPNRAALGRLVVSRLRSAAVSAQTPIRRDLARLHVSFRPFWIVNAIAVTGRRSLVESLAARDDVLRIESDRAFRGLESVRGQAGPNRPNGIEWNVAKIGAPSLWEQGFMGQGAVYANADTGVSWTHPALKAQYRGWDGSTAVHDFNWHDAIHSDISGDGTNPCGFNAVAPCDDGRHGTHTMGTAVGDDGSGNQIGVAPKARWIA